MQNMLMIMDGNVQATQHTLDHLVTEASRYAIHTASLKSEIFPQDWRRPVNEFIIFDDI